MFIEAKNMAKYKISSREGESVCVSKSRDSMIMMPEIAFVTLISGECRTGVTFQIAKKLIKHERMKIFIICIVLIAPLKVGITLVKGG